MRLLLDTHAFLWWIADDRRLTRPAARAIGNPRNEVHFSAVSAWEIVVKSSTGDVRLPGSPDVVLREQLEINGFTQLAIGVAHALGVAALPAIHRDPFDRLLVAQAIAEDLALVSGDESIRSYPVRVVW